MELEEFIETTLLNIKKGIRSANIKIAEDNGGKLGENKTIQYEIDRGSKGTKFDIAVTVVNENHGEGGNKIRVAIVDVGGTKSTASKEEHISRIIFEVNAFKSVH